MPQIRQATVDDIDALCKLLDILFSQEVEFVPNKASQENGLQTIIENEALGDIYVAVKDEKVVAMVNVLYSYSTALGGKVAILEDMIVNPIYRDKKIGTTLLSKVIRILKEQGIKRVTLLTDEDNFKAHNFYAKNGFERSSMIAFRQILED